MKSRETAGGRDRSLRAKKAAWFDVPIGRRAPNRGKGKEMNIPWSVCLLAGLATGWVRAESTPMDTPIEEGVPVTITAEQKQMPGVQEMKHLTRFKERQGVMGPFRYEVRLPKGYQTDPARSWPVIFLVAPEDEDSASAAFVRGWAATNDCVLIDLLDARKGELAPAIGNFLSAHDDAVKRFRLKADGKWMVGTDAVGSPASLLAQYRPGFQGLLLVDAPAYLGSNRRPDMEGLRRNSKIRIALIRGVKGGAVDDSQAVGRALNAPERVGYYMYWEDMDGEPGKTFQKAALWIRGP